MITDICTRCSAQIHNDDDTWLDWTDGDVCGANGDDAPHVPHADRRSPGSLTNGATMTTTPTTPALCWEPLAWETAGTDDPGDQEATSATGPRSFWSVGPAAGGTWIAELVHLDETGAEMPDGALLRCDDEDAAKDAAARYERDHVSPEA